LCIYTELESIVRLEGHAVSRRRESMGEGHTKRHCSMMLHDTDFITHTHTHSQSVKVTCLIDARPRVIIFSASPFVLTHTLSSCLCSRARACVCVCCGRSACESIDIHKFTFFCAYLAVFLAKCCD